MVPKTMALRDAGRMLAGSKGGVEYARLLNLLRSGNLEAGFRLPVKGQILWIPLTPEFWATMQSDRFRSIPK